MAIKQKYQNLTFTIIIRDICLFLVIFYECWTFQCNSKLLWSAL